MTFEARLADAYERYLAQAPVEVDPVTVAATVASAAPRRRWAPAIPAGRNRRIVFLGVVALLLLATVATALLLVGRLNDRPRTPWAYANALVSTPDLPSATAFDKIVALGDGRVLLLAGAGTGTVPLLIDPVSGADETGPPLVTDRGLLISDLAQLSDGRFLVIGDTRPETGAGRTVAGILDPQTLTFREIGPMAVPRVDPAIAVLGDGRVLIVGGLPPGLEVATPDDMIRDIELYDPEENAFTVVGRLPYAPQLDFTVGAVPDGRAAILLPSTTPEGLPEPRLYAFDPVSGRLVEVARTVPESTAGPRLPGTGAFLSLRDGRVLIIGEVAAADGATIPGVATIWDPVSNMIAATKAAPWQFQNAIELDDGRLVLLGLSNLEGTRPASWAATFDLSTGKATPLDSLTACSPGAVKLADGRVAFIGGLEDCEIHNPDQGGQLAPAVPTVQIFQ